MRSVSTFLGYKVSSHPNLITNSYLFFEIKNDLINEFYGNLQKSEDVVRLIDDCLRTGGQSLTTTKTGYSVFAVPAINISKEILEQVLMLARGLKQYAEANQVTLESIFNVRNIKRFGMKAEISDNFEDVGTFNKFYNKQLIDISEKSISEIIQYDSITFNHYLQIYEQATKEWLDSLYLNSSDESVFDLNEFVSNIENNAGIDLNISASATKSEVLSKLYEFFNITKIEENKE